MELKIDSVFECNEKQFISFNTPYCPIVPPDFYQENLIIFKGNSYWNVLGIGRERTMSPEDNWTFLVEKVQGELELKQYDAITLTTEKFLCCGGDEQSPQNHCEDC